MERHNLYANTYYCDDEMKEDEMGEACKMHGGDEKCIHNYIWKT
jgi:hypothetical protein